jgi:hypothetical protein
MNAASRLDRHLTSDASDQQAQLNLAHQSEAHGCDKRHQGR